MRRSFIMHGVLWLALLMPHVASAQPYFEPAIINPTLLTPPPTEHSMEWDAEVSHIAELQKSPDAAELKQARAERDLKPEMVAEAVDAKLTRAAFPALYVLLDRTTDTITSATSKAKDYWKTDRPYIADKRIKKLIDAHTNPAYPSGHTSMAYALAHVLGQLLPEKREVFRARAESIAKHRVLVGMHFPHDLKGGREMALLVVGGLLQNPEFQADFDKAKQELQAHAQ